MDLTEWLNYTVTSRAPRRNWLVCKLLDDRLRHETIGMTLSWIAGNHHNFYLKPLRWRPFAMADRNHCKYELWTAVNTGKPNTGSQFSLINTNHRSTNKKLTLTKYTDYIVSPLIFIAYIISNIRHFYQHQKCQQNETGSGVTTVRWRREKPTGLTSLRCL